MKAKLIPTPYWEINTLPDLPKLQTKYPKISFRDKVKRKSDGFVFKSGDWLECEKGGVVQIIGFDIYKLPTTEKYNRDTGTYEVLTPSKKITRAFYYWIGQIIANDIENIEK